MPAGTAPRLRVLQVTHDLAIGGLQRVVVTLARTLARDRFDVHVLCLNEMGPLATDLRDADVPVRLLQGRRDGRPDYLAFAKVRRLVRDLRVDVLHTHNTQPFIDAGLAGILSRVKTHVHTDHARDFPDKRRYMLAERMLSRFAYRVVGVSQDTSRKLARFEGIPAERIVTIPNGIEGDRYAVRIDEPTKRAELGLGTDALVIGAAVRLTQQKGLEYLVRALPQVLERVPNAVVVIAGEGPLEGELRELAGGLGVASRALFLGARSDVPELLQVFDVYALPSLWEGLPMVVLEAMAAGLPIVASDVGGVSEAVIHRRTGLLVRPQRVGDLVVALSALAGDERVRREFGVEARRVFRERFTAEAMSRCYESLYLRRDQRSVTHR